MATYYVATDGSNSNDGSSGNPWQTINYAMQAARNLQPGDTVIVRSGTYNTSSALSPSSSGSAGGGYITFKSEVVGGAKIVSTANQGINISSKNYIRIEGFDITAVNGGIVANYGHHIEIVNNIVHDCNKNGLYLGRGEYYLVEGNIVHHCTMDGSANNSITVQLMQNTSGDTTTPDYRCIIRGNIFRDNGVSTQKTDGGGIMLDQDPYNPAVTWTPSYYNFPRLVENNICYRNVGPGIIILAGSEPPGATQAARGQNQWAHADVLVRNNTCIENSWRTNAGDMGGNIICRASGTKFVNNIAVADKTFNTIRAIAITSLPKHPIIFEEVEFYNNLTFNGAVGEASIYSNNSGNNNALLPTVGNGNKLGVDPKFVNRATFDLHLASDSPAIDGGTSSHDGDTPTDIEGNTRSGTPDIGAYEAGEAPTSTMSPNSTVATGVYVRSAMTGIAAAINLGGNFTQRSSRESPAPSDWHGDTGNIVQDSFGPVTKTLPSNSLGHIVYAFSMKPEE